MYASYTLHTSHTLHDNVFRDINFVIPRQGWNGNWFFVHSEQTSTQPVRTISILLHLISIDLGCLEISMLHFKFAAFGLDWVRDLPADQAIGGTRYLGGCQITPSIYRKWNNYAVVKFAEARDSIFHCGYENVFNWLSSGPAAAAPTLNPHPFFFQVLMPRVLVCNWTT